MADRKKLRLTASRFKRRQRDVQCRPKNWLHLIATLFAAVLLSLYIMFTLQMRSHSDSNRRETDRMKTETIPKLRGTNEDATVNGNLLRNPSSKTSELQTYVILKSAFGDIRIKLRPDLSRESVTYIQDLVSSPERCSTCNFYRADKPGILQGIMAKSSIQSNSVKGSCPLSIVKVPNTKSKCRGPIMTRGMVGWAGGTSGPDFFIGMYKNPATWWNNDHTVLGCY
mmetsp:Transcript_62294/g.74967  ORF Transcript_62294/g.74967 Transcript_62294/m.74967 type:complete len:226 (-) Transcript_62294:154-831(-)